MTVAELIEILKQYPQDLEMVVSGYEGGYSSMLKVKQLRLRRDVHREWYYGEHEEADDSYWKNKSEVVFHALGVLR